MSRYAISDIHGCIKTFRYLVEEKIKLTTRDELFLLGDYIDRGPDSKGVIDFILALQASGHQVTTLMGNHEDLLLNALEAPEYLSLWLANGGKATLQSFQNAHPADIISNYASFFSGLEYYKPLDDYLLVHAGFDFSVPDPFTDYHAMLWTRNFVPDEKYTQGRRIVHGHTPTRADRIIQSTKAPQPLVLNIDGGCVFGTGLRGLGKLVALNLDTLEPIMVDNRD